jgi:hypothetical protein
MHVIAPAVDREDPEDLAGRIRQTKAVWFPAGMAFGARRFSPLALRYLKAWTATPSAARPQLHGSQSAQRSYERYLALAQEEARSGNVVGAENYYQHAEHYFRLMSSNKEAT